MDLTELEQLVLLVQTAPISALTLRQGGARITIRKGGRSLDIPSVGPPVIAGTAYPVNEDQLRDRDGGAEVPESDDKIREDAQDNTLWVTAPLVGVFHHIKPVVGLGARLVKGQVVGIIEAMKLITEVTSPGAGVIVDATIEDGLPVEYGQHLFALRAIPEISSA